MNYEETIEFINQLDTAHLLTYFWLCFLIVAILLFIYCTISITFIILTRKNQNKYLEKCTEEQKKAILEFRAINFMTKRRNKKQ